MMNGLNLPPAQPLLGPNVVVPNVGPNFGGLAGGLNMAQVCSALDLTCKCLSDRLRDPERTAEQLL